MRQALIYLVVVTTMWGCGMSNRQAAEHIDSGRQSLNAIPQALYDVGMANPELDQAFLASRAQQFEDFKAAQDKVYDELIARLTQQEQQWNSLLTSLATTLGSAVPLGATALEIANLLGNTLSSQSDTIGTLATTDDLNSASTRLNDGIQANDVRISEVGRKVDLIVGGSTDEALLARLNQLNELDLVEFRSSVLKEVNDQGLLQNAEFKETLRSEILAAAQEQGFTDNQINAIRDMSEVEFFDRFLGPGVGGGAGLVGVFALMRTLGKSRGQDEIDKVWAKLSKIQQEAASLGATVASSGGQPVIAGPASGSPSTGASPTSS